MGIDGLIQDILGKRLDRREFFAAVTRLALAASSIYLIDELGCGTLKLPLNQGSLFLQPQTDDEKTVYAICDTILPGTTSAPGSGPGANDVGTMDVIYDKFYPAVQYLPSVIMIIDSSARSKYGRRFYDLDMAERTDVLAGIEGQLGIVDLLYEYVKAPFYVGIISDLGLKYMGYPGPNLGYVDRDFSFYKPMSKEMTSNGNLP
ncbi:MAG: gluconate 2-dehydrogenase subunit 3 family protein [Deltaproteobacteria bacterium]|nr:gluconate 2-dehydrogenase subunit 3 family protein [Deltaproteobacteria bacterium]MCL5277070.1 gluconate 2-dehydrogenase subunit 3 family protein [Deltaproteobacteria bacterium]